MYLAQPSPTKLVEARNFENVYLEVIAVLVGHV